eukprot:TRINITY_DN690_c0_g1_i6.p2 TRINITY_DN690_c0_g1~~TRINITY_DN690_c0_g1_i6.p2  ORF type:complete len:911 (+),score=113.36 TRINITY_DN690_c0_g1_i6:3668-6400(+)
MAEGVVSVLLNNLCELIKKEAHLLARVGPDVQLLRQKFEWIRLSLKEADEKCPEDEQIKLWVAQVRGAAFEAEDIIDEFVLQAKKNPFMVLLPLREIGKKMQEINLRVDKISENRSNFGIGNVRDQGEPSVPIIRNGRKSARVEEVDIVGIEDEAEIISMMLIGGGARTSVVSIVGMGGLGKTTLANKLFNDIHRRRHFECYAWTYVSQEFIVRDLLYDLIKCVKTLSSDDIDKLNSMNEEELSGELFNSLNGKRYFIVLDDIWSREAWDGIQASFPAENKGSRIMITTRNVDVAKYADRRSNPYELRLLKDEECWELLRKKAFPEGANHVHLEELEKVGKDIAIRCNGLPLAAVVLGGLLSTKDQSIHEWRKVLKAIDWHIREGQEKILPILALSYNDLPYYLKMCFLSFAAFPEDSSIGATELIRMWLAEGFVQERGGETLEEVAEDHLLELIRRSLIQVAERRFNGRVKKCRIHDLLRDLAIQTAKENQFLNVYSGNVGSASPTTARRLSVTRGDICQHIHVDHVPKYSRSSLFCFFLSDPPFGSKNWKSLYKCFRLLRVLHMDNVPIRHAIPDGIGDLIHLRYLSMRFRAGRAPTVPSTIYNLYNLQTLYFYGYGYQEVPLLLEQGLWKMKQLRHLDIYHPLRLPEEKHVELIELTNLQTVSLLLIGDWIKRDFNKLTSLRKLGLQGQMSLYQTALSSFIGKQENLESLWLINSSDMPTGFTSSHLHHLEKLVLHGQFERLSTLQKFAPSLIKLHLSDSELLGDSMAVLEKLPKLQFLTLEDVYCDSVKKISCSTKGFPMLESFKIQYCQELEDWTIEEGAFANLRYLEIRACEKLKMIPEGLRHVTTLQELVLVGQPPELCERVRENGLDCWKIQHVQSVKIEALEPLLVFPEVSCSLTRSSLVR